MEACSCRFTNAIIATSLLSDRIPLPRRLALKWVLKVHPSFSQIVPYVALEEVVVLHASSVFEAPATLPDALIIFSNHIAIIHSADTIVSLPSMMVPSVPLCLL